MGVSKKRDKWYNFKVIYTIFNTDLDDPSYTIFSK